jgi:hypothetical protein
MKTHVEHPEEPQRAACWNCGRENQRPINVYTEEGGDLAWRGCEVCVPWALSRGQLPVIQEMVAAFAKKKRVECQHR